MLSYSAYIEPDQDKHSLKNALFINDYELSDIGKHSMELLSDKSLSDLHNEFAWLVQSIWEYQDMQGGRFLPNDLWMKQGYCFFEAINTLRESILAGLNSYLHVSIGGLRSTLELVLLHLFWESTKDDSSEMSEFDDWIYGRVSKLPFKRLVININNKFLFPTDWELTKNVESIYGALCSYAHTPNLKESFTQIKNTNMPVTTQKALIYWMKLYIRTLKWILHLLIACYPMSLFPVNSILKFGFNRPMGLFFDQMNIRPILKVLGISNWKVYQGWYLKNDNNIKNLLEWHKNHPDKTLKQIKETWNKEEMRSKEYRKLKNIKSIKDPELELLMFLVKIKIRAIQLSFVYK
ncbi:hypothetical protein [Paenibacillus apiarius]|uniref:hypothetical protein n=1 Tax=Paenibacillus apiarius TaxID=46240 RepID=UPI00197E00BD|nr:hypothetical protein [Paenibacillus apiarius]MBN3526425.1 hypothetical protein [Paenibacillus apiarius]